MPEPAQTESPAIPFSNAPLLSTAEVITLAEFTAKRAEKFGAMIDTLTAGIAAKAEDAAKSAQAAGFPPNLQRQAAEQTAAKARAEFTTNSDKERWDRIRELTAAADSLGTVDALFANPVTVLSRAGLGTPERTNFTAQVVGAGPAELRQLAAFAVATKNRVLGAALVSAIDRMPTKNRPFSAADLAEHLCGEETRAVRTAIEAVRTSAQRALVANRNFQNNRANPLDTIKLALRNKKETA